jgi:cytochrome P450
MPADEIDLYDPATQQDWYPTYAILRDEAPVFRMPGTNTFVLTRYDDVAYVSRRTDIFANGPAPDAALMHDAEAIRIYKERGRFRRAPLSVDPPMHRRYRDMVDPFFSPRGAEQQRELITRVVNELIDTFIDENEIEFVSRFAEPLPVSIITTMLGFPLTDVHQLKIWSAAWVMPFAGRLTPEEQRYVAEQGVEFQQYILGIIADKRRKPDDSVISHLAHATFADPDGPRPLTDNEILFSTDHLYIGGNETTTFALSSGLWLLLSKPEVEARLRADRSKLATFIDEVLRLESPTQGLYRHTLEDVEMHGVAIAKGSTIHLRFAAANRDHRIFTDPETLDLDRKNSARHVAFGQGEHHCPGAGLSRLEQVVAFDVLLDRISDWKLVPGRNDFRHKPGFVLRALDELHISLTPSGL